MISIFSDNIVYTDVFRYFTAAVLVLNTGKMVIIHVKDNKSCFCCSCVVTPRRAQLPEGALEEGGEEEVHRRREEKL